MILYFIYFVVGVVSGWLILLLKQPFVKLAESSLRLLDGLLKPEKSDEDLDILEGRIKSALVRLILFLFYVSLVFLPTVFLFVFNWSGFFTVDTDNGWIYSGSYIIGTIIPFVVIGYLTPKKDYSFISELFHHLVLDNYNLGRFLLKRQIRKVTEDDSKNTEILVVTGLARAGTTAMTKSLFSNGNFSSLDYSNMPFLMYPRAWSRIYKPQKAEKKEREHGEGVKIGFSSVEALEEYFFKVILDDSFIKEDSLYRHSLNDEDINQYLRYITSIAGDKVYLAKNNNCMLRLDSLASKIEHLKVIIMFRDPITHANSLLNQHRLFTQKQGQDPFILDYMNWLGHHEFGLHHMPFVFGEHATQSKYDPDSLDYWVEQWINYYRYALNFNNSEFVRYENFLASPRETLQTIQENLNLDLAKLDVTPFQKKKLKIGFDNDNLKVEAYAIYDELCSKTQILN